MKYQLKAYSIWEFGQRKDSQGNPHQEDSLFPEFGKQCDSDRLFILCDGMGGHDAGEVASTTVCEAMSRSVLESGHYADGIFTVSDFNAALDDAFTALDAKDNGAEKKMGTTMTFLRLHSGGAFIAHMGDSRVYHIRPGKDGSDTRILFETHDHSLVNDLIKIGELTKEEARHSRQKNVITRAMQPTMDRKPKADIYETTDIRPGDYFYMCSDGMLEQQEMDDGSSLRNIFSAMGGGDSHKVEILKSVTEANRDNHTAFIIHITDVIDPVESLSEDGDSAPADKFMAIVDDDPSEPEIPVIDPVSAPESRNEVSNQAGRKGGKSFGSRILLFCFIAVAVGAIVYGVKNLNSCSSDGNRPDAPFIIKDDGKSAPETEYKNETPKIVPPANADKPVAKPSSAAETPNASVPAQAAPSANANAGVAPAADAEAAARADKIIRSTQSSDDDDVVDSDDQRIQNALSR